MANITMDTHTELLLRIKELKEEKGNQEIEITEQLKEIIDNFNSFSIIKNNLHELTHDKEVQLDVSKIGLDIGATFIIDKLLGRNNSIKGFLSSIIVEKISSSFIKNNTSKIISFFNYLTKK
jgi:hypothetical protein